MNSIYNCISFTKVLVPALFALRGLQLAAMGGKRWAARAGLASSATRTCAKLSRTVQRGAGTRSCARF
jgi:hypothetical protein